MSRKKIHIFVAGEKTKLPANWLCFSHLLLFVDSRTVWEEKWRLFQGKWSTLSTVMRKREPKTRKARRRASWPCWASLGPFSTCWSSSLSTSTPPCDSYPPTGWSQLIWMPWKSHWNSPAWLVVGWSQAPAIARRCPPGIASDVWDHQNLPGTSLLHRRTHPGYRYSCDSNMCTETDTWKAAADTQRPARSLFFRWNYLLYRQRTCHRGILSAFLNVTYLVYIFVSDLKGHIQAMVVFTQYFSVFLEKQTGCVTI